MSLPQHAAAAREQHPAPEHWVVSMATFAGVMMIVTAVFNGIEGLVALFRNEVYVVAPQYIFAFDLTSWGWVHLFVAIIVGVAGVGVMSGQLWGRLVGIAFALLSMIANFLFIPYYPVWSLLIITLDVFVIWALCVYNRDAAAAAD
jgi:hypothetical protein